MPGLVPFVSFLGHDEEGRLIFKNYRVLWEIIVIVAHVTMDGVGLSDLLERNCVGGVVNDDSVPVVQAGWVRDGLLLVYLVETLVGLWA